MTDQKKLAGKKVLLVEDDNFLSNMIAQKLGNSDCVFSHAASGEEALNMVQKDIPDAVLLDLLLPGAIDGFGVLEKLKANHGLKNIPVIVLSNLSRPQDMERVMKLGAFRYLIKASIVPDEIAGYLESAFAGQ